MSKSINQVMSALGVSVAAVGMLGLAIAAPVRAQSSNINDATDPVRNNQPEIFGDNGLNLNGLIDASRRLEQSQDSKFQVDAVDDEVTRFRTAQDRRFGPDIIQEEPGSTSAEESPSAPAEGESLGVENEAVTAPGSSDAESTEAESLDGEASEIAP